MGAHAEFIFRLVDLVEYAENHDLEVATLALNAAVEVIAPSIARDIASKIAAPCATKSDATKSNATKFCTSKSAQPPKLRLIQGGLIQGGLIQGRSRGTSGARGAFIPQMQPSAH